MASTVECPDCQTSFDASMVDEARQIATCGSCGLVVDLGWSSAEGAPKRRLRDAVDLPVGMTMRKWWLGKAGDGPGTLEIKRRWLRTKHFGLLVVVLGLTAWAGHEWTTSGSSTWLIIATIALVMWNLRLLTMFVNSTTIRVEGDRVEVRHGPMPTILFPNQTVVASELSQLFAAKFGAVYEVGAELKDGSRMSLVRPLVSEAQALYVEQRLEEHLGIVDFEVDGELESANLPPGTPARVSTGAGAAIAILPVLLGLAVFYFFSSFSSATEGSLILGDITLTPDSCASGQLKGFLGVELTSEAMPGTVVRAIRDPTRGALMVVERGGQPPVVFDLSQCASLQVSVEQTGTNINQVWAVKGSAIADCAGLKGTVTFDGCH